MLVFLVMSKAYHARNQAISDIAAETEDFFPRYSQWDAYTEVSYGLKLDDGVPRNSFNEGGYGWQKGEVPVVFENEDEIKGFFVNIIGEDYEKRLENIKWQIMKADLFFNFNTERDADFEALIYDGSWEIEQFDRMSFEEIKEELN